MDFDKVLKKRFCCRNFLPKKVEEEKLQKILKAATLAPSAGNIQDWRFCLVENKSLKTAIADACLCQSFIKQAPIVIVVCSDLEEIGARYGERGKNIYSYQNTATAIENLLLKAADLGLFACWVGAFSEKEISRILGLLPNLQPVAVLPLGYCAEKAPAKSRKSLTEVVIFRK